MMNEWKPESYMHWYLPKHPTHGFINSAYINNLEERLAAAEKQFQFIVNILGPEVPLGLPDGADVEWGEALAAADVGLGLVAAPSSGAGAA
jgi:hypothetical protein